MKLDEFKQLLNENNELKEKFSSAIGAKQAITKEEMPEHYSKIAKELGFDVPASEFVLNKIKCKVLSDDELASVTGGVSPKNRNNWPCVDGAQCAADFEDTDCWFSDFCNSAVFAYKCDDRCAVEFNKDYTCAINDYCHYINKTYD